MSDWADSLAAQIAGQHPAEIAKTLRNLVALERQKSIALVEALASKASQEQNATPRPGGELFVMTIRYVAEQLRR